MFKKVKAAYAAQGAMSDTQQERPTQQVNRNGIRLMDRGRNGTIDGQWFAGVDETGRLVFIDAHGKKRKDTFAFGERY